MTPMMEQYFEVKNQYKDYLLFYRIGDFYEMFFDDAKIGSEVLELTLTGRDWGEDERAPMCGIPYHAVDTYIGRLVSKGYKIAICEQVEDPALAKGLVKREVIRIITPGTVVEDSLLSETKNNYLAAIMSEAGAVGVGFCDISTGQLAATQFTGPERFGRLASELATYAPSEILCNTSLPELGEAAELISSRLKASVSPSQYERFDYKTCERLVNNQFGDKFKPDFTNSAITSAIGALISYIAETQKTDLSYISELNVYAESQYLEMDVNTRRNLELCETMRTKEKKGTLLWVLDKTKTAMGARTLRKFTELPLVNSYLINRRLDAVGELAGDFMLRADICEQLSPVLDLERLTTKLVYGSINARDLRAVAQSLEPLPTLKERISGCTSEELREIHDTLDELADMHKLICDAISDENLPLTVKEGGIIKRGYSEEVDKLHDIVANSKEIIANLAEHERAETGIKNLKIGYNRVFGYYIEVTKSNLDLVPDRYIRKQTLTGGERYITEELKETESTILGAADRVNSLEYELFRGVCDELNRNIARIRNTAAQLALIDAYVSLAETAAQNGYVRPEVDYGDETVIVDGRHPVVEKFVDGYFVPNDTRLNTSDSRMMLITGPNMAGKSTYMRQVALITVMAQIGSFVPAREARIGICDKVFTRVGASDDLASGQSTFMLEMTECAHILKNATRRSLIIYDEIGRGTSTYDGMSIARAIAEFTAKKIGAKTLFATHYHELCELEGDIPGIVNYNIAAKKRGDDITFLRKIVKGAADDSYGIEVAKLAGVPNEIIKRAKEVLASIISGALPRPAAKKSEPEPELSFENVLESQLADEVRKLDLNTLTPIEALNTLYQLKKIIE